MPRRLPSQQQQQQHGDRPQAFTSPRAPSQPLAGSQVQAAQLVQAAEEAGPEAAICGQAERPQGGGRRQGGSSHSLERCRLAVGGHSRRNFQVPRAAGMPLTPRCQGQEPAQLRPPAAVAVRKTLDVPPQRAALAHGAPRLQGWWRAKLTVALQRT